MLNNKQGAMNVFLVRGSLALVMLFSVVFCNSQNPKQDLLDLNKNYISCNSFETFITMKCFANMNDDSCIAELKGEVRKSNNCYYSEMMGQITLMNNNFIIVINDEHELIIVSKPGNKDSVLRTPLIDSIYFANNSVKYSNINKNSRTINVILKDDVIDSILITMNKPMLVLNSITYYYKPLEENQFNMIELSYTGTQINNDTSPSAFSEKKFIALNNDTYCGVGNRKNYKIILKRTNPD